MFILNYFYPEKFWCKLLNISILQFYYGYFKTWKSRITLFFIVYKKILYNYNIIKKYTYCQSEIEIFDILVFTCRPFFLQYVKIKK